MTMVIAAETIKGGPRGLPDSNTTANPKTAQKRTPEPASAFILPMLVASWPKNSREEIRVSLSEYQGRKTIDLRLWYFASDGELKPSPKGLTLALAHLPALTDAIAAALKVALEHGLVDGRDGGQ